MGKMNNPLRQILAAHKKGQPVGIASVCSANRLVLEAAMLQAKMDGATALIEATSNQVDQFGGYTGMTPAQFAAFVQDIARKMEFPLENVVLGGDHLGPNVWQNETADSALAKAREQVRAYVAAGFRKIHLDTSMPCAGDSLPLHPAIAAERAADLCRAAESACAKNAALKNPPLYVIGTEVPIPGGAQEELHSLQPTAAEDARRTIELTHKAFLKRGLEAAWERVIALVVQPGVEFGDAAVIEYRREKAAELSRLIEKYPALVYEAHSTDYQTGKALQQMVEDHFAILKVGPGLTFALREAVFALAEIEKEWLPGKKGVFLSNIRETIDAVMRENPRYWQKHYKGNEADVAFARKYSYSDRVRYYWPNPRIEQALNQLIRNLRAYPAPPALLSQYLPVQSRALREQRLANDPLHLIRHKIMEVTAVYSAAAGADMPQAGGQ